MVELLSAGWGPVPGEAFVWLALALAVSSVGWLRVVWFISIGYAFSVVAMAVAGAAQFSGSLNVAVGLHLVLLAAYGLRLGTFLVRRDRKPSYRREIEEAQKQTARLGPALRFVIWTTVSGLYVLMCSPALFNLVALREGPASLPSLPIGLAIMAFGLLLEAWADHQKSDFKKEDPTRFCDVKLYRLVRCPNYLGEMVFWVGQWVAGISAFVHWVHWGMASVGLVCILLIMLGSARRLELTQDQRYGERDDYRAYCRTVPLLFPFVPVYSLRNWKIYLG